MPLTRVPYERLDSLLKENVPRYSKEDGETKKLVKKLSDARLRGFLRKSELIDVCRWKSPRSIRLIKSNPEQRIRDITAKAFRTPYEKRKLELLTSLSGVSIPMASAVLMLTDPKNYGVIDIRVWELMHKIGTVNSNPNGKNFTFKQWYRYLSILRHFAKKFRVKARDVERTLFLYHRDHQKGRLYG